MEKGQTNGVQTTWDKHLRPKIALNSVARCWSVPKPHLSQCQYKLGEFKDSGLHTSGESEVKDESTRLKLRK